MTLNSLQIRGRYPCSDCKAIGIVQHPAWEEFNKHLKQTGSWGRANDEYIQSWFSNRGYNPSRLPPEKIPCRSCDGTGYTEVWLTLPELIDLMGSTEIPWENMAKRKEQL